MKKNIFIVLAAMMTSVSAISVTHVPEYNLIVNENGFVPNPLKVKSNLPLILKITRKTDATCARTLVIPSQNIKVDLPLNKEVSIKVSALTKGEVKFGCAMDMMVSAVMIAE